MKIIFISISILLFVFQITFSQEKDSSEEKKYPFISDQIPLNRKPIYLPKLEYSKAAKAVNASGAVVVRIIISESGDVEEAKPISGHPLLWAESIKAALATKYEPLLLNGKPVKIYGELVYNFLPNETIETQEQTQVSSAPKTNTRPAHPGSILIGKAIKLSKPSFVSCNCRFGKVKGITSVIVQAEINEKGIVSKATAVSGHPLLKSISEQAARKSKFSPSLALNIPVKAKALIVYRFTIVNKWSVKFKDVEVKDIQIQNLPPD